MQRSTSHSVLAEAPKWSIGAWWHHRKVPSRLIFLLQLHRKRPERTSGRRDSDPPPRTQNVVASGPGDVKTCAPLWSRARRRETTSRKRGVDARLLAGKASEAAVNYSCRIGAYEATWKPAERSGYNTFYGSPHCKYPLVRRSEYHCQTPITTV